MKMAYITGKIAKQRGSHTITQIKSGKPQVSATVVTESI